MKSKEGSFSCPGQGYIKNCLIVPRPGDGPLFGMVGMVEGCNITVTGVGEPYLDGYAIIPKENYEDMLEDRKAINGLVFELYRGRDRS